MSARFSKGLAALATVAVLLAAAEGATAQAGQRYNPKTPAKWAKEVTNPYFPLLPGTTYKYAGKTKDGQETVTVEVLSRPRRVNGVTATAVRDRVYLGGQLVEETEDWYAQDADGNVWYLGEDSKKMKAGRVVGTEGSWEWAVKGALPGIVMWSDPTTHVGEKYRQEFLKGEAEDFATVVTINQGVKVLSGEFTGCITTEDGSFVEPNVLETKTYCPKVGFVLETVIGKERIELISVTRP